MKLTLESTDTQIVMHGLPVRMWEGTSESGLPCHAYIATVMLHPDEPDPPNLRVDLTKQSTMEPGCSVQRSRAIAAYAAFGESLRWQKLGSSMPQFSQLSKEEQNAWEAASAATLQHWLDIDFRQAVGMDSLVQCNALNLFGSLVKSGQTDLLEAMRIALCHFVIALIDPAALVANGCHTIVGVKRNDETS